MTFFNLPPELQDAKAVIERAVRRGEELNTSLILNKYANRYAVGLKEGGEWREGSQSELKRQIYLLSEARLEVVEELRSAVERRRGGVGRTERGLERLEKALRALEECDVEGALRELGRERAFQRLRGKLAGIRLALPCRLMPLRLYEGYKRRFQEMLSVLRGQGWSVRQADLKLSWRLSVDLGAASVYETSINLHRNYGVPVVPGSAVKGVTRHYASTIKIAKPLFEQIFGDINRKGEVLFFDALPLPEGKDCFVVLDVMNVHYKKYYETQTEPPGDWMSPVPVFFLAVEGICYRFSVAARDEKLADEALRLVKGAVRELGVGAKTSAGYGFFEEG